MLRKITLWSLFGIFSLGCVTWLSFLVLDAAQSESIRWGAKKIRAERALRAKGPIVIGVAGGWESSYLAVLNGVNLAQDEINRDGTVLGRPLEIVPRDDRLAVATGMQVAQEFADNLDMVAVIGHPTSTVSLSTAVIYEYYGLLMLSPLASNPALTLQGRRLVFRNIPTDEADGVALAEHAAKQGYRRVAIYYLQDDYSRGLANIFERRCYELGITIVDRLPYESTYKASDFDADFDLWKRQFDFDAVLLAGLLPQAGDIVTRIRQAGITAPILSGGSLENERLIRMAGEDAEGVVVVSTFDPHARKAEVAAFVKAYREKYGSVPNRNAAQGYDALHLLAHVIREGGSTVPEVMAATLRKITNWQGVTGPHTFDDKGDVLGKPMVVKAIEDGSFQVVPQLD
jgi:branched-chain amino acid transport system substrate-binding protein